MQRIGSFALTLDRLAFFAVGLFVLVVTWNGFRLGDGAVNNVFLVLAATAAGARIVIGRRPVPLPPFLIVAGIGLALAALLNVIFPPDWGLINDTLVEYRTLPGTPIAFLVPRSDFWGLIQFEIALLCIPVMIASVATTRARVDRLLDLFVLSATVSAAVGVLDLAGLPVAPIDTGTSRTAGLTIHPNYLALSCTVAAPMALLWLTRRGRWPAWGLLATALLLAGAYASGSRAGAVSTVLAIALTVLVIPRLRRLLGVVVPVAGIGLLAIVLVYGQEMLEQIRLSGDTGTVVNTTGSNSERAQLAELALDQFAARPVQGVGFGVIADAHNIYLQLLAAGGVIAMASFLTFVAGLGGALRRAMTGVQRDAAVAAGVGILMWLVNGVVDNQVADKYLYVVPGILLGMSYVAVGTTEGADRSSASAGVARSRRGHPSLIGAR